MGEEDEEGDVGEETGEVWGGGEPDWWRRRIEA